MAVTFTSMFVFEIKTAHSSENDHQSVPWTWSFKNWVQLTHAIILIPTWRAGLKVAVSYSMLKFRQFCRFCRPQNSEIFGSVLRFGLCSLDRHEKLTICRAIYEDQENIYMLGSDTSSRRVSAFRASLGCFFRKSTISGFFFRTHHIPRDKRSMVKLKNCVLTFEVAKLNFFWTCHMWFDNPKWANDTFLYTTPPN